MPPSDRLETEGFYENPFAAETAQEVAAAAPQESASREQNLHASYFKVVGFSAGSQGGAKAKSSASTLKPRALAFNEHDYSKVEVSPFVADEEITTTLDYSHLRPNVSLVPASVFDVSAYGLQPSVLEEEKDQCFKHGLAEAVFK